VSGLLSAPTTITLGVAGTGVTVLAVAGAVFYLVAIRK
jgi:hypothetical protein